MNKKILLLLILISSILFTCGKKTNFDKPSKGPLDVIYVLSDEETWNELKPAIDTCFKKYGIMTPEFQPFFHVSWYSINKLTIFNQYRNLIVLANLNKKGLGKNLAEELLPQDHLELAQQDSVNIFSIDDNFAKNQVFFLIAGKDVNKITEHVASRKGFIFAKFNKKYKERTKENIFDRREQKNITRHLWNKYKWTFRVPKKFVTIKESPDSNFFWMGTMLPYRWFSVTWKEGMHTRWMTLHGIMEQRQELGKLYDGIKADTTYVSHYYTKLNDFQALKMTGLWFSVKEAKGGPFSCFTFYDSHSHRTFMLDMLIYEPSPDKVTDFYRQMEIIANTFTTQYSKSIYKQ